GHRPHRSRYLACNRWRRSRASKPKSKPLAFNTPSLFNVLFYPLGLVDGQSAGDRHNKGNARTDTIEDQTISTLTEVLKPQQVPPRVLKSAPGEAVARSRLANEPLSAPSRSSGSIPNHPNSGLQKAKFGSLSADFRAGVGALMLPERGQVTG